MHKIKLKDIRFLHDNFLSETDNNLIILISSGDHFIDMDQDTFRNASGYEYIDRKLTRIAFQQRSLDTHKWQYFTNDYGKLLLNNYL